MARIGKHVTTICVPRSPVSWIFEPSARSAKLLTTARARAGNLRRETEREEVQDCREGRQVQGFELDIEEEGGT